MTLCVSCKKDNENEPSGGGDFIDGHEYVDLGLPSGLLWATCNVGASSPEDYGDYFAWAETQPKSYYDVNTYTYHDSQYGGYTKYNNTDNLTILQVQPRPIGAVAGAPRLVRNGGSLSTIALRCG